MTARPEDYGDGYVARTGLVIAFDVGELQRVDPSVIAMAPGWAQDELTGEGIPTANEYPFGSFNAWTAALAVKG